MPTLKPFFCDIVIMGRVVIIAQDQSHAEEIKEAGWPCMFGNDFLKCDMLWGAFHREHDAPTDEGIRLASGFK